MDKPALDPNRLVNVFSQGNVAHQMSGVQFGVGPVGPSNSQGVCFNQSIGRVDWHGGVSPGRDPGFSFGASFKL